MSSGSKSQTKGKRYIYFYFNRNKVEKIIEVIPRHIQYWQTAAVNDYIGGPFSDHIGGLILFRASNLEDAINITLRDPFLTENLITQRWIKEWDSD